MIEWITKDSALAILSSHFADATQEGQNLIGVMMSEVRDVAPVRRFPESDPAMDKLLEDSGWE